MLVVYFSSAHGFTEEKIRNLMIDLCGKYDKDLRDMEDILLSPYIKLWHAVDHGEEYDMEEIKKMIREADEKYAQIGHRYTKDISTYLALCNENIELSYPYWKVGDILRDHCDTIRKEFFTHHFNNATITINELSIEVDFHYHHTGAPFINNRDTLGVYLKDLFMFYMECFPNLEYIKVWDHYKYKYVNYKSLYDLPDIFSGEKISPDKYVC